MPGPGKAAWFALLGCAWATLLVAAAPVRAAALSADEHPDTWDMPPTADQLERDPTLIPVGKGALFVPAMTDPAREPQYVVLKDDQIVQTVETGRRAVLDPGIYEVRHGSGALEERFARHVLVKEGRTTVVPATWCTLIINVVDDRSEPFRGSYELFRMPAGQNLGLGLGADVQLGDEVRAWVLEPGRYMLIKTGESPRARRDFYTFRLAPGELTKVVAVIDRLDGSLLGAGEVPFGGFDSGIQDLRLHLLIGGDAEFSRRVGMAGYPSGYGFTLGGFLDFLVQYKPERHLVYMRLRLEEKQVKLPDQPFQKDQDLLKLDTLYMFRALPWFGPYVRAGMDTNLFPGQVYFDNPTEVLEINGAGRTLGSFGRWDGKFTLTKSFAPIELRTGGGISFITTASYVLDANMRVGFGGRALFNRGLLAFQDYTPAGQYVVLRREDVFQYGMEATVVATLRPTNWLLATTELEFLETIEDPRHPVIDWESNVALRIVSFLSLNYINKTIYDLERGPGLQTEHRVLLRFTWQAL